MASGPAPDPGDTSDPRESGVPEVCHACGLVQRVPRLATGWRPICARCDTPLADPARRSHDLTPTFTLALAALILYPLALTLPIMELERLGHRTTASIWSGSLALLRERQLFAGLVVFACSIVLPLGKLVSLLCITGLGHRLARPHRARTWRFVELTGRWGMLDVLLIACLVAWVKLGDLAHVTPGPGVAAFALCVVASLAASALFDPRALWIDGEVRA